MYSNTIDTAFAPTVATTEAGRPSLIKRIFDRIAAGQERRARVIVRAHLVQHSDAALLGLGWTHAEIAELRRGPVVPGRLPL